MKDCLKSRLGQEIFYIDCGCEELRVIYHIVSVVVYFMNYVIDFLLADTYLTLQKNFFQLRCLD